VEEKLYPLVSHKSEDSCKPINFCSEFSSTRLGLFAVLGTLTKGYQKRDTVWFAILVPFTTSDKGNGHNCVPHCTVLSRTAQWKQAISVCSAVSALRNKGVENNLQRQQVTN